MDDLRRSLKLDASSAALFDLLDTMVLSLEAGQGTGAFAESLDLGGGVTGYMYHTVPVALHAWLTHPDDYRAAVQAVIRCGGDTDTVAAITGAVVGARVGATGVPDEWKHGVIDWPRSMRWVERLAATVGDGAWRAAPQPAQHLAVWAVLLRNAAFVPLVLLHGFRRLLPPY